MASISIVLKAIDKYSGVITGLNQGFELVGKTISFVKGSAKLAFAAINKGVEIASEGGKYAEIRRQFDQVANSFAVDGAAILGDLDKITGNMIKLEDAAKIAGEGISAGLTREDLATAFEFIKRRTELTGESFEGLSDQVVSAISKGETSVLKQMGLVIEQGAKTADIMAVLKDETKAYGDAGFNAADKIAVLSAAKDKFLKAVGIAINELPIFQSILTKVTDAVIGFIEWFDPRPIIAFTQAAVEAIVSVAKGALSSFPLLKQYFDSFFTDTAKKASEWALFIGLKAFDVASAAGETINNILGFLSQSGLTDAVSLIVITIINTVEGGINLVKIAYVSGIKLVLDGLKEGLAAVGIIIAKSPKIASYFGLEVQDIRKYIKQVDVVSDWLIAVEEKYSGALGAGADFARELVATAAEGAKVIKIDTSAIDIAKKKFSDGIKKIDFSKDWTAALSDPGKFGTKGAGKAARQAIQDAIDLKAKQEADAKIEAQNSIKKTKEEEARIKKEAAVAKQELEKSAKIKEREEAKSLAALEKEKKAEESTKKVIEESIKQQGVLNQLSTQEYLKLGSNDRLLLEIEEKRRDKIARERLEFEYDLRQRERDSIVDTEMRPIRMLKEMFSDIDWPAELETLGRFLFAWVLVAAQNERIPLAIGVRP